MNWLRKLFCSHQFDIQEAPARLETGWIWTKTTEGIRIQLLCKKCGYHDSFWKFIN